MYDYMKRFCDIAANGTAEEDPLKLSRMLGQMEILAELCSKTYPLTGLCETLAQEMLKLQEKLDNLAKAPVVTIAAASPETKTVYKQEYVRCGKVNCTKCASRPGHGPYWYAYNFAGGQSRKRYIGLNLPSDLIEGHAEVRYALPLNRESCATCQEECSRFGGALKEPCCQLQHSKN
jgi:hypothetical protein